MNVDQVRRTYQAGVIEISGFEIQRIESPLLSIVGIGVAAGNIHFQSQTRLPLRIPGVAGVEARGPRQDVFIAKSSDLKGGLAVPIPVVVSAEKTRPKCVAVLVAGSRGIFTVFIRDAEVIQVNPEFARRIKPVGDIKSPERGGGIAAGNSTYVLDRSREKGRRFPKQTGIILIEPQTFVSRRHELAF